MHMSIRSAAVQNTLLKVENVFQKAGRPGIRQSDEESDFSVYVHFIMENSVLLEKLTSLSKNTTVLENSLPVDETTTNRFLKILRRVAKGNEGVSRQDRIFVYQFWTAFQTC